MSKGYSKHKFWNLKRIFYFPKLNTKNVCLLGLLIAITFVLSSVSGYLRIGNISKLTISFISIFIAAYSYGGLVGGFVAVIADLISCFVNPVGPLMLQITLIEFIFGFTYGFFFYKTTKKMYIINVFVCSVIQLIINILFKTLVLSISFVTPYYVLFLSRLPMCIIQFIMIFAVLILIKDFMKTIDKIK